jgi:hypothetical protein
VTFGRPKRRWKGNITADYNEIDWWDGRWLEPAHDEIQ